MVMRLVVVPIAVVLVAVALAGCGAEPFALAAAGPYAYPAATNASLERVAIVVTVTNRSGDDLLISPAEFVARDADKRIYASNPAATVADAGLVNRWPATRGTLPLPAMTLRRDDVVSGFVVFDVPVGVRPVELIWRQSDFDSIVRLASGR